MNINESLKQFMVLVCFAERKQRSRHKYSRLSKPVVYKYFGREQGFQHYH